MGHTTETWSDHVIIDNTPPVVAHVAVGILTQEDFLPGHEFPVHWEGVEDKESGITSIQVVFDLYSYLLSLFTLDDSQYSV